MNRYFRNRTPVKNPKSQPSRWNWLLVGILLGCGPVWAEMIQTKWVWQFGTVDSSWLYRATISQDGKLVLTAGNLYTASLWSAENGTLLRTFPARDPHGVALSPDGTRVLTGSTNNTANLWASADGTWLRSFEGPADMAAFSPDGARVVTMSAAGAAKLWSAGDGTLLRTFAGTGGALAFSADGTKLLTGTKLWSVGDGTLLRNFTLGKPLAALSPDGTQVLTTGQEWYDNTAMLWSAVDGKLLRTFTPQPAGGSQVLSGIFSPDGTMILTGGTDDTAKLWSVTDATLLRTFSASMGYVLSVAFSHDGSMLLTGTSLGTAFLWHIDPAARQGPKITVEPVSQTNFVGNAVKFEVTATGSEPLTYQWRKDGAILAGATNASLTLFPLALSDVGSYRVVVANNLGGVTSAPAWLTCLAAPVEVVQTHWARQFGLGTLSGATFSSNSEWLLTYGGFGADVWSVTNGTLLRHFPGQAGGVSSAALSPDGTQLLTGGRDSPARLWSMGDGSLRRSIPGSGGKLAFSADGKKALTGNKLWSTEDWTLIRAFEESVSDLSPDGSEVLVSNGTWPFTGASVLWTNGFHLRDFYGYGNATHPDPFGGGVFSPDGKQVLTVWGMSGIGIQTSMRLFSIPDGTGVSTFSGSLIRGNNMALTPNGTRVLSAGGDGTAKLWWARNGGLSRTFAGTALALSPDGTDVVTLGANDALQLWSTRDGTLSRTFLGYSGGVGSVAFSPDGTTVLTSAASPDNSAKLWSVGDGALLRTLAAPSNDVYCAAFSPDGTQVLVGTAAYHLDAATGRQSVYGVLVLWSVGDGQWLRTLAGHSNYIYSAAFSPDGAQVLTGSGDATAKLWAAADGTLLRTFRHSNSVTSVAFSPDGSQVLTGSDDQTAKLWSAEDGQSLRTFTHSNSVNSVAFSPDGSKVLIGSGNLWREGVDNSAKLWSARDGTWLRTFSCTSSVNSVAFSPDGTKVLVGTGGHRSDMATGAYSSFGVPMLWSALDGTLLRIFAGHSDTVNSVAFSPDGAKALSGSSDGVALMWNIVEPERPAPRILSAVMLSPSGLFQIRLEGETGVTYRLEGSTNLLDWTSLFTTNLTTGVWEWVDPQSAPTSPRFYRAVLP